MKIGILGKGVVGSAVYEGMTLLGHEVTFHDPKYPATKIEDVVDTEVVFVCVPTEQKPLNGACDTSIVYRVVDELNFFNYKGVVAIKSTVEPGTCTILHKIYPDLRICSVPEFLRAKSAMADFVYNHDLLIIGTYDEKDAEIIEDSHFNLPERTCVISPTEAEMVKYFNNVHHAMSVTFANIMYEVCKKLDCSYDHVYSTITQRTCFNPAYLRCNDNLRGFGGHCLPKDTAAFNYLIKKFGLNYTLIESILTDNIEFLK